MLKTDNYELAREQAQQYFLTRPQEPVLKKPFIRSDEDYFTVSILSKSCRVHRRSGCVEWVAPNGATSPADFNTSLTVYDLLCDSRPDASLSRQFTSVGSLNPVFTSSAGSSFFSASAELFDSDPSLLEKACLALDGSPVSLKGDLCFRIPLFDFMPVILQFWESDDEFPASLSLLWDSNVLQFLHFETLFYAAGILMAELREFYKNSDSK